MNLIHADRILRLVEQRGCLRFQYRVLASFLFMVEQGVTEPACRRAYFCLNYARWSHNDELGAEAEYLCDKLQSRIVAICDTKAFETPERFVDRMLSRPPGPRRIEELHLMELDALILGHPWCDVERPQTWIQQDAQAFLRALIERRQRLVVDPVKSEGLPKMIVQAIGARPVDMKKRVENLFALLKNRYFADP